MRILVTVARTPFVPNAAGARGEALVRALVATKGVKAEMMTIPSNLRDGERIVEEAILCGLLRTGNADRMVALNFPAYNMPYPSASIWIATAADLPQAGGGPDRAGTLADAMAHADARAFERAERLFCGSADLIDRVQKWCGARAELLLVPDDGDAEGWAQVAARIAA